MGCDGLLPGGIPGSPLTDMPWISQRVAERLGAERECIAKNRLYFQGRPLDAVVFSITPQALTDVL